MSNNHLRNSFAWLNSIWHIRCVFYSYHNFTTIVRINDSYTICGNNSVFYSIMVPRNQTTGSKLIVNMVS